MTESQKVGQLLQTKRKETNSRVEGGQTHVPKLSRDVKCTHTINQSIIASRVWRSALGILEFHFFASESLRYFSEVGFFLYLPSWLKILKGDSTSTVAILQEINVKSIN